MKAKRKGSGIGALAVVMSLAVLLSNCECKETSVEANKYTVQFGVSGMGGNIKATVDGAAIESGALVEHGKTIIFTAEPDADYIVDMWTGVVPDETDIKKANCVVNGNVAIELGFYTAKNYRITMTTSKAIGETITLAIDAAPADQPYVWLDLNNNGIKDAGEEITYFISNGDYRGDYTIARQTFSLYGKVTEFATIAHDDGFFGGPGSPDNRFTSLDVSKNTALISLDCRVNQLTSLDVSKNTALTWLSCNSNQLTSLDVSKNTKLEWLVCGDNQLANLDVTKNTALTTLGCSKNQLTNLDVSKNTALVSLYCGANRLANLDVSKNTALVNLGCSDNQLANLDVSKNTALTWLDCGANQLANFDVSKNTALKNLECGANRLANLDVSKNTALVNLYCGANRLANLDVSKNTALASLECDGNQLVNLDVSKNTALGWLACNDNQLTSLDVSKNTALTSLECGANRLANLDVTKNTALTWLDCQSNKIQGENMNKLINSLPIVSGRSGFFHIINSKASAERNTCTEQNINDAEAKNWRTVVD